MDRMLPTVPKTNRNGAKIFHNVFAVVYSENTYGYIDGKSVVLSVVFPSVTLPQMATVLPAIFTNEIINLQS